MAKTENAQTAQTTNKRTLKKVSATQINLSKQPVGFHFEGKFVGLNQSQRIDEEGEEKTFHTLVIESETGERTKMLADAGLRTALSDAMVVQGDWFKAVKQDKIQLTGGRTMNTWDIFQYAENN